MASHALHGLHKTQPDNPMGLGWVIATQFDRSQQVLMKVEESRAVWTVKGLTAELVVSVSETQGVLRLQAEPKVSSP
jgi:hypothetical protein